MTILLFIVLLLGSGDGCGRHSLGMATCTAGLELGVVLVKRQPPLARGQCPRESQQRSVGQLASSRGEDQRLHARAGYNPGYVGPNITRIMLSSHLCWGGARRGMVAGLLSFQHNISVDNRIYWYPKRCSCDYLTVLCAFF